MKIVLGKPPTSFTKKVEFPLCGEDTGYLTVDYKYRSRTEMAELMEQLDAVEINTDGEFKLSETLKHSVDNLAETLNKILVGWDLDAKFTPKNVHQFCDEYPNGAQAVISQYSLELIELRSGN